MGRIGEPGDIANAVVFLVSPESGWITAQMLTVDGGRMDYVGQVNLGSVGLVQGRTSIAGSFSAFCSSPEVAKRAGRRRNVTEANC